MTYQQRQKEYQRQKLIQDLNFAHHTLAVTLSAL